MSRNPIVPQVHPGGQEPPDPGDSTEAGAPDPARLRDAFARWATGVAVLALRDEDGVHALTVSAFMAVSLRPPLVAVAVGEHAALAPMLLPGAEFTVSLLSAGQRRQANIFADTFAVDRSAFPAGGDAVLAGSLAALTCRVESAQAAGDHVLVLGSVRRLDLGPDQLPLLFFERAYRWLRE